MDSCVIGRYFNLVLSIFLQIAMVDGRTYVVEEIVVPLCSHEIIYGNR
jgi:hypothetical protein